METFMSRAGCYSDKLMAEFAEKKMDYYESKNLKWTLRNFTNPNIKQSLYNINRELRRQQTPIQTDICLENSMDPHTYEMACSHFRLNCVRTW